MVVFTADGDVDWENSPDDEEEEPAFECPVCGKITLPYRGSYYACTNCGWHDDPGQSELDPDETDCANRMSLNQARQAYKDGRKIM